MLNSIRNLRPSLLSQRVKKAVVTRQASVLTGTERQEALAALTSSGWSLHPDRDAVQKKFEFKDFVEAWGFMSK